MRERIQTAPRSVDVLLLQPRDDGLDMYLEFLRYHGLAAVGISDPIDALVAAPRADIIVTGLLLAGCMDGVEFIDRLRRDPRTKQTPVVVLSACVWEADRERTRQAGCDLFLPKPCLPDVLLGHLRRVLAESRSRAVCPTPHS